ncbi:hypothetical protein Kpol_392p12 [Vanderwaltozyma polyspora DSM 70294]|uniref:Uncharacterized protein n=1 Tax=Vanderwaltozyma polyspora (strain ATCC 22028 / DSM 70294 / BCRC 21397 / CBS 2163 / NBRC 10782 / NRRL Y-8283 / UCD 57-17) TaxID=436907 RepID=A7TRS3_VANPO|nr:uncharacterized protein Kpol_392p12 [Vanderwaltozyma polyspora DSM 70294]EDO15045.1 hypothetical protein Kpol_392p12 [Vanderwaltozyma polyspora DSM 70294]
MGINVCDENAQFNQYNIFHGKADASRSLKLNLQKTNRGFQRRDLNYQEPIDSESSLKQVAAQQKIPDNKLNWTLDFDKCIGDLGTINYDFIPDSPSLYGVLYHSERDKMCKMLDHSIAMELSANVFVDFDESSTFDCVPFYKCYDYENRIELDDPYAIVSSMIDYEMKHEKPVFPRELEFQELKSFLRFIHIILYYLFGIDRTGYYKLKDERDRFHYNISNELTASLNYKDKTVNLINLNVQNSDYHFNESDLSIDIVDEKSQTNSSDDEELENGEGETASSDIVDQNSFDVNGSIIV